MCSSKNLIIYWLNSLIYLLGFKYISCQNQFPSTSSVPSDLLPFAEQNIADLCFTSTYINCSLSINSKYRTIDGKCNNLIKPWWGSINTPYIRLMKAHYKDSVHHYRVSEADGSELPSARLLSTTFFPSLNEKQDIHTRMFMVFAQLISHDVTLNPLSQGSSCCSATGDAIVSTSGNCRPISIPANDPFFSQFSRKCQEYRQSADINCTAVKTPLQPQIFTTSFLDASFVYGDTKEKSASLRTGQQGQLQSQSSPDGKQYLPIQDVSKCPFAKKRCYNGGDARVNQHLELALAETMFMRFHNFIATKLIQINPQWATKDDLVFEEARRIVIGCYQHIVYNEWLPLMIGRDFMSQLGLLPMLEGYGFGYSDTINPGSLADFAGAAFRTLHSLIPNTISINQYGVSLPQHLPFSTTVQHPGDFLQDGNVWGQALQGLLSEPQFLLDNFITDEITNKFMDGLVPRSSNGKFGDDLAAKDIQRGRDYGLPSYVAYKELCEGVKTTSFNDLLDTFDATTIQYLSLVYKDVRDIDYYVGSLLEKSTPGILATPSLRCVFAEAFARYRNGDRYFYEWANQPGTFSPDQLKTIRSITLSTVICITGEVSITQLDSFILPGYQGNPLIPCSDLIAMFDLSPFKESV